MIFPDLACITFDSAVMGGKPCIRGMRVTVGMIKGPSLCHGAFTKNVHGGRGAGTISRLVAGCGTCEPASMSATVEIPVPDALLLHSKDLGSRQQRSRLLLATKFFELGELSSGQAAEMCGLSRVGFLFEAGKLGVAVAELADEELAGEFT